MRILVVCNGYPPRGRWGTEFYTRELVQGLRSRGHELAVLHPERSGARPRYELEELEEDGVHVALLHNPGDARKRFEESYRDERVEARFAELVERTSPTIVHFTYLLWGLSVRLPVVARRLGVPSVATLTDYGTLCHRAQMFDHRLTRCFGPHPAAVCARCIREPGPYDLEPWKLALKRGLVRALAGVGGAGRVVVARDVERREACVREALDALDALVAPTHGLGEVFRRAGVPADKLMELVYSLDEEPYRAVRGAPPPQPPRFGFLAQFAPHKGLGTLVEAAAILDRRAPSRAWEVVLHGGRPQGRNALYASRVLDGAERRRVRVAAPFAPDEAPGVIAGLSAVVLPSAWDENAPLSVLQARAVGVPVLGTDVPGIAEVVGDPGRLVPVGDAAALAERMEAVLDGEIGRDPDPGLPLPLDRHLDRIEALYARIAGRAG